MRRRARIDISKRETQVVLVDDIRGQFTADNFAKNGFRQLQARKFLLSRPRALQGIGSIIVWIKDAKALMMP